MYPSEENAFTMPNHEKNGYNYKINVYVLFDGWTLILRKIMEGKTFLAEPKHQYHVSQWGECVYDA